MGERGPERVGKQQHHLDPGRPAAVFLALMVMVRDDCNLVPEFLRHHREQGVARFYIIDNNSSMPCPAYSAGGDDDVVVWRWTSRPSANRSKGNQMDAYRHFLPKVQAEGSNWLAIWDIDEFVFGSKQTLADVLNELPSQAEQLCMPWLTFGSSGMMRRPTCVATANVYRRHVHLLDGVGKCVQRTASLLYPTIHRSLLGNETWQSRKPHACLCPDLRTPCLGGGTSSIACRHTLPSLPRHAVRLHHYVSPSHESMKDKMIRGDADLLRKHRDRLYWARQELINNEILDTTLRDHPRVACRTPLGDESPRPMFDASLNLSWNTWSGLPVTAAPLGGIIGCHPAGHKDCTRSEAGSNYVIAKEIVYRTAKKKHYMHEIALRSAKGKQTPE
jgi:hypothetical protein